MPASNARIDFRKSLSGAASGAKWLDEDPDNLKTRSMTSIGFIAWPRQAALLATLLVPSAGWSDPLPEEKPLWPEMGWHNPIQYDVPEAVHQHDSGKASLSGLNRVYSFISKPTYSIHAPAEAMANGVGLVICPGGGFRELSFGGRRVPRF